MGQGRHRRPEIHEGRCALALGMLDLHEARPSISSPSTRASRLDLATIPAEDPRTYAMIRKADTLGVFQIESRAQMSMLPRIKPRTFYDLVIEVAIVRPGPIQGDMVHPYLRRREGMEPWSIPSPNWSRCSARRSACRCSRSRRCASRSNAPASRQARPTSSGGAWRRSNIPAASRHSATSWSPAWSPRGYSQEFAEQTFRQLEGFGSYGFPESHAASFALDRLRLVLDEMLASGCVLRRAPQRAAHGLLCARPDRARRAATSASRCARSASTPRAGTARWSRPATRSRFAVRLGLRMVRGLANAHAAAIVTARADRPFASVDDLWRRAGVPAACARAARRGGRVPARDGTRPARGALGDQGAAR